MIGLYLFFFILLPKDLKKIVIEYLNLSAKDDIIDPNIYFRRTYCYIDDNEENRKKIDKVLAFTEKHLKNEEAAQKIRQKRAEAFIDNYINSKEN